MVKYSPTVVASYQSDDDWFNGCSSNFLYDSEGYDCLGYNHKGLDRAGYSSQDYSDHKLYMRVRGQWSAGALGKPVVAV